MSRAARRRQQRAQQSGRTSPHHALFYDWWTASGRAWAVDDAARRAYPEIPGIPPAWVAAELATTVNCAVAAEFGSTIGRCAVVAAVANGVLFQVTGRRYILQAGGLAFPIRYPDGGGGVFTMDPAQSGYAGAEFHAWNAARGQHGRVEIVDLAAGHYGAWAARMGVTLVLPPGTDTLAARWGDVGRAGELLPGLQLVADPVSTSMVAEALRSRTALTTALILRVQPEVQALRQRWAVTIAR